MINQKTTNKITESELLEILSESEFVFGVYLRAVRRAKNISIRQLAKNVNKTPTYISDIEKGNNKPPEKKLLDEIILHLDISDYTDTIKNNLYDLAAEERNDIPADIKEYIMENKALLQMIRTEKCKPNDKQIWSKLLERA